MFKLPIFNLRMDYSILNLLNILFECVASYPVSSMLTKAVQESDDLYIAQLVTKVSNSIIA